MSKVQIDFEVLEDIIIELMVEIKQLLHKEGNVE